MEKSALQRALHGTFTEAGFSLVEELPDTHSLYKATLELPGEWGGNHNVFLSFDARGVVSRSTFGKSDDITTEEFEAVRAPDDGYEIEIALGNASLIRGFPPEDVLADPAQFIDAAITLGTHAAAYEFAIARNKRDREALVGKLKPLVDDSDNWEVVSSGQVSVDDFIADAERLFDISPNRDLWAYLVVTARRAARHSWATGAINLGDQPWTKIRERLEAYGTRRGWEVTDQDWE